MEATILALEKSGMERWRKGDPWGYIEMCAEDLLYVSPALTKPFYTLDDFKAYREPQRGKISYEISEFIDPKVVVVGDAALLTYNYNAASVTLHGKVKSQTLWNSTTVYFRMQGDWRIAHTHWSYVRHILPQSIEIPLPVQLAEAKYTGVLGELMALESMAMERWRKGDPWGFIEISAPDVTYFDTGTEQRINGQDALREEYAEREGKIFYDVMEFIDPRVKVCGEVASLFYRFFSTRLNPDGSVSMRTPWNCTEIYRKIDGQWKIIHTHWSLINGVRM
jgi:ketosteroid isomerase-like protein